MGDGSSGQRPSRLGPRSVAGEIVEVQGGHIVRSTGRKDRHSKVCTAKGPRDRRVRLAAHTAIQFYDVQDRLGYDRPSKAVDWLIKKAKNAIDELAELPPWHPTSSCSAASSSRHNASFEEQNDVLKKIENQGFLPPSLDSDDAIKTFFPMGGGGAPAESNSSTMQFQNNFPIPDLLSRSGNSQDLRLSLQSFQDPILLHHRNQQQQQSQQHNQQEHVQAPQVLLSGTPLGFDAWTEQRLAAAWNPDLIPQQHHHHQQQILSQNQFSSSQRGPLQSSNNTPSVRAWIDPTSLFPAVVPIYPSSMQGIGFAASGVCGFSGFHIPARIQGDEEEQQHHGYSDNKPSSASSDSRH